MADIEIQGRQFFLVSIGGGTTVHLAPDDARQGPEALTTLCGRDWGYREKDPDAAPTCRRCMASVDRLFPRPPRDARVDLIAHLVVDALQEQGVAEVVGVPGDQMSALRAAVRRAVKNRLGFKLKTHVLGGRLIIDCPEAYAPHEEAHMQKVAEAMNAIFTDGDASRVDDSGWRFHWATWSAQ